MALIRCPECGKEISDKVTACPHCGYPLAAEAAPAPEIEKSRDEEPEKSSPDEPEAPIKKRVTKKIAVIVSCICVVLVVGGILAFVLTGNLRAYKAAEKLYDAKDYPAAATAFQELGEYQDAPERYQECQYQLAGEHLTEQEYEKASSIYKELGDYKDSAEQYSRSQYALASAYFDEEQYEKAGEIFAALGDYQDSADLAASCELAQTIDGQYLLAMQKGLETRWDFIENSDESTMTDKEFIDFRLKTINCELDILSKFKDMEFENPELQKKAMDYIELLEESVEVMNAYTSTSQEYLPNWNRIYSKRSILVIDLYQNHGLKFNSKYQQTVDDMVKESVTYQKQQAFETTLQGMVDQIQFNLVTNDYGWKTYSAQITNGTDKTFDYFGLSVDLLDANGTILASEYTNQISNFAPGATGNFEFFTDKDFASLRWTAEYFVS